jgi:hypothetical protein
LDGLLDERRPGAPRTIGDAVVEQVIAKTLHQKPPQATHWSSRTMAKASRLSQTALVRIWHAFGLQPHRAETFKLSTGPLIIDKVRNIVGLYLGTWQQRVSRRGRPSNCPWNCCSNLRSSLKTSVIQRRRRRLTDE